MEGAQDLTELACVDAILLDLVIHDSLGCAENPGRAALITLRAFERLKDQFPFVGVNTPLEIVLIPNFISCFHELTPKTGARASGIGKEVNSS